jgi:hypothetical protein
MNHYSFTHGSSRSSLSSQSWFFHDLDRKQQQQLKHHIKEDDYFGTLATVLQLLSEKGHINEKSTLDEIIDELTYLQEHYRIQKNNQ